MINSPIRAYDALLVVVAAMVGDAVILLEFVAIDFVLNTATVWGYMIVVGVVTVCAVVSRLADLPEILSSGFGGRGQ